MTATTPAWIATIDTPDLGVLAPLRLIPSLEIALIPPILWLRGTEWNDTLALACRKIPGLRRYTLLHGKRLLAEGRRVPSGILPDLRWQPLRESLPVTLPAAQKAHPHHEPQAALTLIRSTAVQAATALLTTWPAWHAFATAAPEIRLRLLRFAVAHDSRVWIEGDPVPALPGQRFTCQHQIAVSCGWTWSPALDTAILRRRFALADGDTALALPEGHWEIIKAEQFVPASRQAVRLTAEELAT